MNTASRAPRRAALSLVTTVLGAAAGAWAGTPVHLERFVDGDREDADEALEERGYASLGSEHRDRNTVGFWWQAQTQECIAVVSRDGRVRAIEAEKSAVCEDRGADRRGHHGSHHDRDRALPKEITGLVGNKREDGEQKLAKLGFAKVDDEERHGSTFGMWWNRTSSECLRVEANDGRIRGIDRARRSECD